MNENKVEKFWKLDSPMMCRDFLRQIRGPNGQKILFLSLANGTDITLDQASDEQIMQAANDIAAAIENNE